MTTQEYAESLTDNELEFELAQLEYLVAQEAQLTDDQVLLLMHIGRQFWYRHVLALLSA